MRSDLWFLTVASVGAQQALAGSSDAGNGATFNYGIDFSNAKGYSSPANCDNNCTPQQQNGWNFQNAPTGPIQSYQGFNLTGNWTVSDHGQKKLNARNWALLGKLLGGSCQMGGQGLSMSAGPNSGVNSFSPNSMQVSSNQPARMEIHYGMPGGGTCRQNVFMQQGMNTITNNQCGGANSMNIIYPQQVAPAGQAPLPQSCNINVHSINWNCNRPQGQGQATASAQAQATANGVSPIQPNVVQTAGATATANANAGNTPVGINTIPGQGVPTVSVPGQQIASTVTTTLNQQQTASTVTTTVGQQTQQTQQSQQSQSFGSTGSTYITTFSTTSTIFTTMTTTITNCAPGMPQCGTQTTGSLVTTVTSSVTTTICQVTQTLTSGFPVPTAPLPSTPSLPGGNGTSPNMPPGSPLGQPPPAPPCLPRCLNTHLGTSMPQCKSNIDVSCYCTDQTFVELTCECMAAWGKTADVMQAINYFQGMCAPYISQNPAIATCGNKFTQMVSATGATTITSLVYTTIIYVSGNTSSSVCVPNLAPPTSVPPLTSVSVPTSAPPLTGASASIPTSAPPFVPTSTGVPMGGNQSVGSTSVGGSPPLSSPPLSSPPMGTGGFPAIPTSSPPYGSTGISPSLAVTAGAGRVDAGIMAAAALALMAAFLL